VIFDDYRRSNSENNWSEIDDKKMNRVNAPFEREAAIRFVNVVGEFQLHGWRRK